MPDVGLTYLLPRVVGLGKAMELMFSNEMIDAAEALRIGMVNRVVPRDRLEDEAVEMASALATSSRTSLEWIKRITYMNLDLTMEQAFRQESLIQSMLAQTGDFQEALEAFKQKRAPNPA